MNRTLLCLLLGAVLAGVGAVPAPAQPQRTLTPDEAVALALAHSRTVGAAEAQAAEAEARHREARTLRLPTVGGQGSYQRLSPNVPGFEVSLPTAPGPATVVPPIHNRYNLQLSVQQPLFTGGRLGANVEAAGALAEAARQEQARTEADVALEVEQAYWSYYKARAVQTVVQGAVEQVEAHLQNVRNFLQTGLATTGDVLTVEARRADVALRRVEAENAVRLAQLQLNHLTGLPLGTVVEPAADVAVAPLAEGVDALVAQALGQRAELAGLERQVDALAAGVRAAQAARLPQLALSGTYRFARPNPYWLPPKDAFVGTWDVGVVLSMDFWNAGRTGAQVQQARARQLQAEERLEGVRERVVLDVHRRYLEVVRAEETVAVARQNVAAAEEAYRVAGERYAQGLALNTEVLDAETAQRDARTRYEQALADYALARAGLRRAVR